MMEVVEGRPGASIDAWVREVLAGMAPPIPDGLVVFSFGDDGLARSHGGYSFTVPGPPGFTNHFVSPEVGGESIYVAVLHWGHRYGACGYDEAGELVSETAIDGQCRNQPGSACTTHNGYSMCANLVGSAYASTPTTFVAANVTHEFLHPFGRYGTFDHYGTEQCREAMGWGADWVFSVADAEDWLGQCPYLFDAFEAGIRP
jgi:hypothetical protein